MRRTTALKIAVFLSTLSPVVAANAAVTAPHRCARRHIDGVLVTAISTNYRCATAAAVARRVIRRSQPCIGCYVRARRRLWDCAGEWAPATGQSDGTSRLDVSCGTAPGGRLWVRFRFRRFHGSAD